jgi:hypothetical protein
MVTYPRNEDEDAHLERCMVCNAVVIGFNYANTVCTSSGRTLVAPPFEDSDYLKMVMKAVALPKGRWSQ